MNDVTHDRVKLAEVMGWKIKPNHPGSFADKQGYEDWISPDGVPLQKLPDPFTDANDDVAVLKWAREKWARENLMPRQFVKFSENIANLLIGLEKKKPFDALCISLTTEYKIGFYAKAVVLVLDKRSPNE